jgi:hypothetical protein
MTSPNDLPVASPKSEEGTATQPVPSVPVVEVSLTAGPDKLQSNRAGGQEKAPISVPDGIRPLVDDAIRLVVYLTGNGDNPRPEIISAVFAAQKAIRDNSWSIATSNTFLEAFSAICKQAKPVTARTLFDSEKCEKGSITHWSFLVWILLPILMLLSAFSYSNSRFASNAKELIQYSYKVEMPGFVPSIPSDDSGGSGAPIASSGAPIASSGAPTSQQKAPLPTQVSSTAHIDAINEIAAQMHANMSMLEKISLIDWFLPYGEISGDVEPRAIRNLFRRVAQANAERAEAGGDRPSADLDEVDVAIANLRVVRAKLKVVDAMDRIVYGVLNTYILPLLCALLGATAYGLRSLSEQVLAKTYRESRAPYARVILAVIVGFAVGFFSDFTAKLSVQPLAAAFLAGYAVESFFIFLDTVLQAVQKPRSSAA